MRIIGVLLLLVALAGCAGTAEVPAPDGVTFRLEQALSNTDSRKVRVQVVNDGDAPLTIESLVLTAGRLDGPATFDGHAVVPPGETTKLAVVLPRSRCGKGLTASLKVEYRRGSHEPVTSVVDPEDVDGSVADRFDRDCAQGTLERAATIVVDPVFEIDGQGGDSVLHLGVTFEPRSDAVPVTVEGIEPTGLFTFDGDEDGIVGHTIHADDKPFRIDLPLRPTRCDERVLKDEVTGMLFPLHVRGQEVTGSFFLPLSNAQRGELRDFVTQHCGLGQ